MTDVVSVAVVPDFREEGWPSMDRVADELLRHLARDHRSRVQATSVRPRFRRRATRVGRAPLAVKIDRGLNRFLDYPRHLSAWTRQFDVFHVLDHSYAQLVHQLPAERTVVTCHDLDAFGSLFRPDQVRRSWAFRAMTRRVLDGLRRAAFVTCDTAAIRDELVAQLGLPIDRVAVVPVGVSDVFSAEPDAAADRAIDRLLGPRSAEIELLHVGGVAPRKRIDVLLATVAALRRTHPNVRLVRVGDPLTEEQRQMAQGLGLDGRLTTLGSIDDEVLAATYRRAALVLVPSEREGFGLPVAESLASATPVVASDLPVLREVGGAVAAFCPVGDVRAWTATVAGLLDERATTPAQWAARRERGVGWVARFRWARFAGDLVGIYERLAGAARRQETLAWPA